MINNEFEENEFFFRAVHPKHWDEENNSCSSATFKDSGGCSVDRQGKRDVENSIHALKNRRPNSKAIIYLTYIQIVSSNAKPLSDPIIDNEFHTLLTNADGSIPINKSTAKKLTGSVKDIFVM